MNNDTIDSWYIAAQNNTIWHRVQQLRMQNFGHTSKAQKQPLPLWFLEKSELFAETWRQYIGSPLYLDASGDKLPMILRATQSHANIVISFICIYVDKEVHKNVTIHTSFNRADRVYQLSEPDKPGVMHITPAHRDSHIRCQSQAIFLYTVNPIHYIIFMCFGFLLLWKSFSPNWLETTRWIVLYELLSIHF